jgi:hypothetical protein
MQIVKAARSPAAIVQMEQIAQRAELHLVGRAFGGEGEKLFFFVEYDCHNVILRIYL